MKTPNHSTNGSESLQAIAERLAQVQSTTMAPALAAAHLGAMRDAVLAANPASFRDARNWFVVLVAFVSDVATEHDEDLWSVLTEAKVSRWVSTRVAQGDSRHTMQTRRGVLVRLLSAQRGFEVGRAAQRRRGLTCAPLTTSQVERLFAGCQGDSRSAVRGFVAYVAAGVPRSARKVRFSTGANPSLANAVTDWPITPIDLDLTTFNGDFLDEEDWVALAGVAEDLGLRLNDQMALQTFRVLATSDVALTLAERLTHYGLSEPAITATFEHAGPLTVSEAEQTALLREGRGGECEGRVVATRSARSTTPVAQGGAFLGRRTSRSTSRSLMATKVAEREARAAKAAPIAEYLASFVPDNDDALWDQIADDVRAFTTACLFTSVETTRKHAVALAVFLRWRAQLGHPTDKSALDFAVIDAFVVKGMPDLSERSKRDYRTRLRTIATRANASVAAPPSLELGYNQVNPGYSKKDEVALRRVSMMQPTPETRRRLCAIIGLCAGAGLNAGEVRALKRSDIRLDEDGTIHVTVTGENARRTVVRRAYERHVLVALEGLGGEDTVLPVLAKESNIGVYLKGAAMLETAPSIDTRRLRTTWICWLMTQRVPLQLAFAASGLRSARTFYDMLAYLSEVPEPSELRDGGTK